MYRIIVTITAAVLAVVATACSTPLGESPSGSTCQPPTDPLTVVATHPGRPPAYSHIELGTDEWRTACDHVKSLGATDATTPHHEEEWDEDTCTLTYQLGCSYKVGGQATDITYSLVLTEDRPGTWLGTVQETVDGVPGDVWDAGATSNPLPVLVPQNLGGGK